MEEQVLQKLLDIISFNKLFTAALVLLATWAFLTLLEKSLQTVAEKFSRHRLLLNRIYPITRIIVWSIITVFIVLVILRPPESIVFALLGSAGLAIGLAAQGGIRNMLAGLMIMFNPPYRVGDMITLAGHYGEVIKLEWSVTWLRTFDDNTVMIPNAEILNNPVSNSNSGALDEMIVVDIDIPASSDHRLAAALAREATCCSPFVFLKKPISVITSTRFDYGHHLVRLTIKAYVLDVRFERRFASDITQRTLDAYKKNGILPTIAA